MHPSRRGPSPAQRITHQATHQDFIINPRTANTIPAIKDLIAAMPRVISTVRERCERDLQLSEKPPTLGQAQDRATGSLSKSPALRSLRRGLRSTDTEHVAPMMRP